MAALRVLLSILLISFAPRIFAAAPESVFLEDLTWTELKDRIDAGKTTIIVPIGGTEQNGPAIALGKHNVRARVLAQKIALALGDALVAPVVAYVPEGGINPPSAHMRFPGTITIPDDAFERTLEYAARSFQLHGFRDIVFIGDHGGYQKNLTAVAQRLNRAWSATRVRAHAIDAYYRTVEADYAQTLKRRGFSDAEIGRHGGLADTSLALAVNAQAVRADRLASPEINRAHGVYGDPKRASAELGEIGVEMIVARTVEAIKKSVVRRP